MNIKKLIFKCSFIPLACACVSCRSTNDFITTLRVVGHKNYLNQIPRFIKKYEENIAFLYIKINSKDNDEHEYFCYRDDSKAFLNELKNTDIKTYDIGGTTPKPKIPLDSTPCIIVQYGYIGYWPESERQEYVIYFRDLYDEATKETEFSLYDYPDGDVWNGDSYGYILSYEGAQNLLNICFTLIPTLEDKYNLALESWK